MRRHSVATVVALVLASIGLLASAVLAAPQVRNFAAPLDSGQEIPPVDSEATGVAHFTLDRDGDALAYRLNVANIEDVTMAHIHVGTRGVNGPVVVWLYPDAPPAQLIEGRTQGTLAAGVVTGDDLVGPLAGQDLDALIELIRAGEAYVNVHTLEHPAGEIRGQIDVPRGHQS
jgi:hypothetical protein